MQDEDRKAFFALIGGLETDLQPQGTLESSLVETMAVSRWRLMRLWAIERALFCGTESNPEDDPAIRDAIVFRTLAGSSGVLELLNRYETRFDRQFARALNNSSGSAPTL